MILNQNVARKPSIPAKMNLEMSYYLYPNQKLFFNHSTQEKESLHPEPQCTIEGPSEKKHLLWVLFQAELVSKEAYCKLGKEPNDFEMSLSHHIEDGQPKTTKLQKEQKQKYNCKDHVWKRP